MNHSTAVDGKPIYESLRDYLNGARDAGMLVHPLELVLAADFAARLSRPIKNDATQKAFYLELRNQQSEYLSWAWRACADLDRSPEGRACRFVVRTSRACAIMRDHPNGDGFAATIVDVKEAEQLDPNGIDLYDFEWFEFLGDRHFNSKHAAEYYLRGLLHPTVRGHQEKLRLPTLVKYFGSCMDADLLPHPEALGFARNLNKRQLARLEKYTTCGTGMHQLSYVRTRWAKGRTTLRAFHKAVPSNAAFSNNRFVP